jgi:hypothetical protein
MIIRFAESEMRPARVAALSPIRISANADHAANLVVHRAKSKGEFQ